MTAKLSQKFDFEPLKINGKTLTDELMMILDEILCQKSCRNLSLLINN